MKNRYKLLLIGMPITLVLGFLGFIYFIAVSFEYREDHNGVGWSKFANSIRHHIEQGPNDLGELGHYEGKVWFDVKDPNGNVYHIWTSRGGYADARDMHSLKSQYLSIKSVNGQVLECLNNFDEPVYVGVSTVNNTHMDVGLTSLNLIIDRHVSPLSNFGEKLPMTYEIENEVVLNAPEWLDFKIKRSTECSCNSDDTVALDPPTSISCQLK